MMENMELILNGDALSEMMRQEIAGCVRENIAVDKEFYPAILEEIKKSVTDLWNEREQKYLEYLKQKTVGAIINAVFDGLQEKAVPMLQEAINTRYGELTTLEKARVYLQWLTDAAREREEYQSLIQEFREFALGETHEPPES